LPMVASRAESRTKIVGVLRELGLLKDVSAKVSA
jgi:hypothetical protein